MYFCTFKKNMKSKSLLTGHIACFSAYLIFGINLVGCKSLANANLISPIGLFCLRSFFATCLFWLLSLFLPKEKVEKKDLLRIFFASMLGLYVTQLSFLKAITVTTPLDASILASFSPILTMFVAAVYLKEPITLKKAGGVLLSFGGVFLLLFNSVHIGGGVDHTEPFGVLMMVCNCLAFALYLGLFKPLIAKYKVVTFMKWMFLFSMLASVPFDLRELVSIHYTSLPLPFLRSLIFLVVFATFVAYFLIPLGQKTLRPTLVSMYSYVQPLIAAIISIILGMDVLNWQKLTAAALVFGGVVLVNRSRAAEHVKN